MAEITENYTYFDNQTIGDLLAKAPGTIQTLITQFKNRRSTF